MSGVPSSILNQTQRLATKALKNGQFSGESLVPGDINLERVKVMSYNVLADSLVARRLYTPEELRFIDIDQRIPRIVKEISTLDPDILLLQEKYKNERLTDDLLHERGYKV